MASVKIFKGNKEKVVSVSTFENFFKNSGWELADNKKSAIPQPKEDKKEVKKVEETIEENNNDEWDEVLKEEEDEGVEKPLSEMNKRELIEYADKNGISLAGLTTNSQFRKAIQEYMKEV